jgi:hypothetical protein
MEMHSEVRENLSFGEPWCRLNKQLAEAVSLISDIFMLLDGKRETLEERMIKSYFVQIATYCCSSIEKVLRLFQCQSKCLAAEPDPVFVQLIEELLAALKEFLKIGRYDCNFLEQYYEYDFYLKLQNEFFFHVRFEKAVSYLDGLVLADR